MTSFRLHSSSSSRALTHRQHHPKACLVDVYASLDANVPASAGLGNLASAGLGARADLCLRTRVSLFSLDIRVVLGPSLDLVSGLLGLDGEAAVNAQIEVLVNSYGSRYPYPSGAPPIDL